MEILVVSRSFIFREGMKVFFNRRFDKYTIEFSRSVLELGDIDISKVNLAFIDIDEDTIDYINRIKEVLSDKKVIVVDKHKNIKVLLKSIKNNMDGYISEIPEEEDLVYISKKVLGGSKYYDADLLNQIVGFKQYDVEGLSLLTSREAQVVECVIQGFTNKEIADKLYITEHTVKKHITSILSKLNLKNRKDIIVSASNPLDGKMILS